jgi:hypothetical protein
MSAHSAPYPAAIEELKIRIREELQKAVSNILSQRTNVLLVMEFNVHFQGIEFLCTCP